MTRSFALLATLVLSTSYAVGCGEDVGPCNDPNQGRDTVLSSNTVMYAGQAILNRSCARGCHSAQATGEKRQGAPSGLDFNLAPVSEENAKGKKKSTDEIVKLSTEQLDGLRKRQKVVYENRDLIWEQVSEGLMPPDGMFAMFKSLKGLFQTKESLPCEEGEELENLDEEHDVLRNWLACGAPIVESQGAVVQDSPTPGVVGYQYPLCDAESVASASLVEEPVTLDKLMKIQFVSCSGCHPLLSKPSFQDLDKIMAEVVDSKAEACDGKPYVTKGDPEKSFLYDLLSKEEPGCNHTRMPSFLEPLNKAQLKQVWDWIESGAPATEADVKEPDEREEPEPEEDAGEPVEDASRPDVGGSSDAGRDGGVGDTGRDAGRDTGRDAGRDAGATGGRDAGRDAGRFGF